MGCLGVHFALTSADEQALRAIASGDDRVEHVKEVIEERELGGEWAYDTDKAWDAIHRCLTDGSLAYDNGTFPLSHVILGGEVMHEGDDYILSFKTESQVRDIAAALQCVTKGRLRKAFDSLDEDDYGMELDEEHFEYTWEYFKDLQTFFAKAAKAGRSVLFTADQ